MNSYSLLPSGRGRRRALLGSTILMCAAGLSPQAALGQEVDIDADRDTAVDTVSLLGTGAGTVNLNEDVTITAPTGPVITVNGPHSLNLLGTIQSFDTTGGIGIFADTSAGSLLSNISLDGTITLTGPEGFELDPTLETTNVGILISGANSFEGDLTLDNGSNITVWGANGHGVLITSPFVGDIVLDGTIGVVGNNAIGVSIENSVTGNVTVDGPILATNAGGAGVSITGAIDGAFEFTGVITAGTGATQDDDGNLIDAQPSQAAILVANDITGGILLQGTGVEFTDDGDGDDSTTLIDSDIITDGGTPAVRIENPGTLGGDLTIGFVDGLGYGLVARGDMEVNGVSEGVEATGILVSGFSQSERTIIEGGIHLDTGEINLSSVDATATAIRVGDHAEVPEIWNRGSIFVDARISSELDDDANTVYGIGGDSFGVLIEEDATVTTFTNDGRIFVGSTGPNVNATALVDLSGTLTTIRNTDELRALIGNPTDDPTTGNAIAIDVRANTSGISLFNSGDIVGDILLGSGDDLVEFADGTLDGDFNFGSGANSFTLAGTSEFTGSISHTGTLDLFVSGADLELGLNQELEVTNASFSDGATISFIVDPELGQQGSLLATSGISIDADTRIDPDVASFVFTETSFTFVSAGALDLPDTDLNSLLTETPFIYNTTLSRVEGEPNSLALTVAPKTAAEIGLGEKQSVLYGHFIDTEFNPNDRIENALTGLTSQEETNDAFTSVLGDSSSASMDLALLFGDMQDTLLRDSLTVFSRADNADNRFWARQVATYGTGDSSSIEDWATEFISVGVTVGSEIATSDNFAWGFGGGFLLSGISREENVGDELSVFTPFLNLYAMTKAGGLFAGLSGSAAYYDIDRERIITIGNTTQTAESNTSAYQFEGTFIAGYELNAGKFTLRPTGGIKATYYSESGYTEEGASGANQSVGSRSLSRIDAHAGVAAGFDFNWRTGANPVIVRPEFFARYEKNISGGDGGTVDIGFTDTGVRVAYDIDSLGEETKAAGAVLRIFGTGNEIAIRYTYRDKEFLQSHEASLQFRLSF